MTIRRTVLAGLAATLLLPALPAQAQNLKLRAAGVELVLRDHEQRQALGARAAHALDAGLPDALVAASVAKAKASDAAHVAVAKLIQYHGGIGFTWEHDAHFFIERALRENQVLGDADQHRELIAALVTA